MNTFLRKRKNRKRTWKCPNGQMKSEIDFILTAYPGIVPDVEVVGKVKSSDYRMVRSRLRLDLRIERIKLLKRKKPNLQSVTGREQEFRVTLQNKFAVLTACMKIA